MIGGLSLLAGTLLGLGAAGLPHESWNWVAGLFSAAVLLSPARRALPARRLAFLLAGMTFVCASARQWQELHLAPTSTDTRLLLEGTILSVPARSGADLNFDAQVRILDGPGARDARLRRARLAWREPAIEPRVGERWRLIARLGHAGETSNFAGADHERAAFRERVHFTARVLPAALNARLALAGGSVDQLRARIARRIAASVADPDAAGLITALAVGVTSGMSADQWRVFNATGTTHLVAISGMHVTLFALLAIAGARTAWRWLPGARRVAREPFALLLGLAAAGGYALLAGYSVPTQRTWVMLAVFCCARLCARCVAAGRTWSLALIAVLLLDHFAPLAAGFWLSFAAVGAILAIEATSLLPAARLRAARLRAALTLQLAVTLALAPLTFAVFGGVSLVGLAVNLLAIPIISFIFVPIVLAGAMAAWLFPAADGLLFGIAAKLYEWLWPGMVWAADVDLAQWRAIPPPWWYALALPALLLGLKRWPLGLRFSATAILLPLLAAPSRMPEPDTLRVSVLDTGRGSALLLATHEHIVLFDTGDAWNTRGARIAQVVTPALDALGRRQVDLLILPGLNPDRAMGSAALAALRGVNRIVVGGRWSGTSLPVARCADARFHWDGVEFEIFAAGRAREYCVLRVSASGHALLLAGDLDARAERELLARLPLRALASDVALMSRQAGAPGSVPEWIDSIHARLAIASGGISGSNSRALTIARWRASGARILDTRREGAIEFTFGTQGIVVRAPARAARYPFAWRRVD